MVQKHLQDQLVGIINFLKSFLTKNDFFLKKKKKRLYFVATKYKNFNKKVKFLVIHISEISVLNKTFCLYIFSTFFYLRN
ncbi:Hypothetical protein MCYN_0552 [Mycoplasmopsis cynos C142]|uniref:Uncharacterized protein n=1 Tax=Mycoplasmopsis cynos (strain C142) TaxID=1246955 RepID=L0RUU4_MYCC1|nr:Hypothetical protein MCYN_0552 [Mycoplasmopsis cynos C142]